MSRDGRRVERIELRLTADELAVWKALADSYGVTVADLVRDAVRRYADREATELADFGRTVLAAAKKVRQRPAGGPRRR